MAIPTDKTDFVRKKLNRYSKNIQFTHKIEQAKKIRFFLDIVPLRDDDGSLKTDIKPFSSGRLLDYRSCHTIHQKLTTVNNSLLITLSHHKLHNDNTK